MMKIAQIAPIIESIPPKRYGGTERVIHELTEELVKRGHEVTLFASGDSKTSAKLVSIFPEALRNKKIKNMSFINAMSVQHIGMAYRQQNEFDIIHDHNATMSLAVAHNARRPVVVTYHGPYNEEISEVFRKLNRPYVVSISKSQVKNAENINHAGTVYNGLSMEHFPFSDTHDGYLLFVGRISMEKGLHHAIAAALELDLPLLIAAKLDPVDLGYFNDYILPFLSESIRWVGEVNEEERNRLMSKAMCFLHPITWPEPFGLTLIESMACGCPVIAIGKGSIPEIILDGKTGFVISEPEEMISKIQKIDTIKREDCRKHALENFSAKKMADGYEKIYEKILAEKNI
ncbi:MAG TPA: glycosyl transferase [Candidatus Moranbacteria bacterium]|nr:glycosyl transferase [Candidatus Moranbacteria bacterium]